MLSSLKAGGLPRLCSLLHSSAARATLWKHSRRRTHAALQQRAQPQAHHGPTSAAAQHVAATLPSSGTGVVLSSQANYYRVRLDQEVVGEAAGAGVRTVQREPSAPVA